MSQEKRSSFSSSSTIYDVLEYGSDRSQTLASFEECRNFLHEVNSSDNCLDLTCSTPIIPAMDIKNTNNNIHKSMHGHHYESGTKGSIVDYYKKHGVKGISKGSVVTANSTLDILENILKGLGNRSDEKKEKKTILIPCPTFGQYIERIPADYEIIFVPAEGMNVDVNNLLTYIEKDKPSVLLIQNPVNPTGQILSNEDLKIIANKCKKHNVVVICDEISIDTVLYEENEGSNIPSMASYMEQSDNQYDDSNDDSHLNSVFVLNGVSKSFGAPGVRLSFGVSSKENWENLDIKSASLPSPTLSYGSEVYSEESWKARVTYRNNNGYNLKTKKALVKGALKKLNEAIYTSMQNVNENVCTNEYIKLKMEDNMAVAILDFSALSECDFLGKTHTTGLQIAQTLLTKANFGVVPGEAFFIDPKLMTCRIAISEHQAVVAGLNNITKLVEFPALLDKSNEVLRNKLLKNAASIDTRFSKAI